MSLAQFAVRRRVTIAMATIAVALFGAVSLGRLDVNLLPDLSYPTLTVRTQLPGAAPVEVENLVTRPIEEATGILGGVRSLRSVSRSGRSDVVLEFGWGTDMDLAAIEVRERVDLLQLPNEAERPLLLRFDPATDPVLRLALIDTGAADQDPARLMELRQHADLRLKPELEAIDGSAAIKVSGGFEEQIHVTVDQQRLAVFGLGVAQVSERLAAENVNLSGGRLEQGSQRFIVRTVNEFDTLEAMADAVVAVRDGRAVRLRDVATVQRGHRDRDSITRVDGRESIELAVYREGDANTVQLAARIAARLEALRAALPPGTELRVVQDQSKFIAAATTGVRDAAIWGGLLTVIVLYLFLRDARATLVAGLAIPVTVIGIFVMMYGFGLSLNVMSLGGIALSIGMLVDNAVVILESIARKREAGLPARQAALEGTAEVAQAVTASTLTTIAVFFPLVFVSGIAGQLFRDQALTVTFAQLLSLLASLTLVPMLSAGGKAAAGTPAAAAGPTTGMPAHGRRRLAWLNPLRILGPLADRTSAATRRVEHAYGPLLQQLLAHRRQVIAAALLVLAATVVIATRLATELIPELQQAELNIQLRLPAGASLETTDRLLRDAQTRIAAVDGIERSHSVAGSGHRLDASPVDAGDNTGVLTVTLDDSGRRKLAQTQAALRAALADLPGAAIDIARPALVQTATPLEIVLAGADLERLATASAQTSRALLATGAFVDLRSSVEAGQPEIRIEFDPERAAQLGLSVRDIADRVVAGIRGQTATRYRWQDRRIDVLVRSVDARDAAVEDVRAIVVNPGAERPVTLDAVARVTVATGPAEIRRLGQQRVAILAAAPADGDLGAATRRAEQVLAATPLPAGISASVAGQSEDMRAGFESLWLALALAMFLVYLVMASQFESLRHPFVILLTIPLALCGAVWALWITGSTLNAVAFIGLILLAGIVVNNSIVLVDAINQRRGQGLALDAAIIAAGRTRLRPILITSLSTIVGLLPMALGLGDGAEIRRPMAITVIGGMLCATAVTLFVIPALYAALERAPQAMPQTAPAAGVSP
jgi:hydrophobic/amphiphilic exporter-1 (mainly G- bacteria), HAE1 family